jgi:S-adenosylmethionine-diacylglycerol 3-amino-3-carboxypropyl transferase
MITSAGENAFDYLLDKPNSIDCVDINPYQNYLFDLKCGLYKNNQSELLSELFLTGKTSHYRSVFQEVKRYLKEDSEIFWDHRIHWFSTNKGFYNQALTGKFAALLNFILDKKGLRSKIEQLIVEESLQKRKEIFSTVEHTLWKGISKNIWKSDFVLGLAGIPNNQKESVADLNNYMRRTLRNLFVNQGAKDNYFWRLYLLGGYTYDCKPNYLHEIHFNTIRDQISKLKVYNNSITDHLNTSKKKYSHFILLDHQDWMIGNGTNELENEWVNILRRSTPKAKILFRSVHTGLDILPDFVVKKTTRIPIDENYLNENDRVGTYPSTLLLEVNV